MKPDLLGKSAGSLKRFRRWALLGVLLCVVAIPASASVADIIVLLKTITTTLQNGIGAVLSDIRTVENTINTLHQEVVWPLQLIQQTKGFVFSTFNQYRSLLNQVRNIGVESATLVNPSHLEAAFRGAGSNSFGAIQGSYVQVYSTVPTATDAHARERNMMDMDDASAIGSLKTASLSDQTSGRMLILADNIEQQASSAAPGSAPLLTTQAQIANLENQAYLAKMLAAELRVEATKLAHENALMKKSAEHSTSLRNSMQQVLK